MSDIEEAVGTIIGLGAGGAMLLLMSQNLDAEIGVNLPFWGSVFILVATFLGVLLIVGVVKSVVEGL